MLELLEGTVIDFCVYDPTLLLCGSVGVRTVLTKGGGGAAGERPEERLGSGWTPSFTPLHGPLVLITISLDGCVKLLAS